MQDRSASTGHAPARSEDSRLADERVRTLSYAVRSAVVLYYLGELWLVLAVLSLAPPIVTLLAGELDRLAWASLPAVVFAALGLALRRGRRPEGLELHEALVIATLVFAVSPAVAAISFAGWGLSPIDALFEAVSGMTTTGLSTLAAVEGRSRAFLFTRAWLQWYGGLGIVVLSLALVVGPGVSARRLAAATAEEDEGLGSVRAYARRVLAVYALLTAGGVALLAALGAGGFDALTYTLAAVSTGGFAPHDASLAGLARPIQVAVIGLCTAGAVSLPLYARIRRRGLRAVAADIELRALLVAGTLATALLVAIGGTSVVDAALLAFSAQTTAGFSSVDVSALAPASLLALVVSMAVGGSVGSTAGGVKLLRVIVVFQMTRWVVTRTRLPSRAVAAPRLGGEALTSEDAQRAFALVGVFAAAALLSWFPFVVAGYDPMSALFEVVSALGTVGLSTGITAPDLPPALKAVLCADMLLGRLEILAVVVTLAPGTWMGRKRD